MLCYKQNIDPTTFCNASWELVSFCFTSRLINLKQKKKSQLKKLWNYGHSRLADTKFKIEKRSVNQWKQFMQTQTYAICFVYIIETGNWK